MNTCIIKSVQSIEKYISYLLDVDKHQNQIIIENNVIEKTQYLLDNSALWKSQQESKKGHKPKPLSVVLSFSSGTKKEEFISLGLEKLHLWFKKISEIEHLGLNDDDIQVIVENTPYVAHYKESNPHIHFLVGKVFESKKLQKLEYLNLYTYKYSDILYKLSGWTLQEKLNSKIQNQKNKNSKSSTLYLKDKLYNEIEHYKGLNEKLDKYITLLEKDLEKGHFEKAKKKIEKIKRNNNNG